MPSSGQLFSTFLQASNSNIISLESEDPLKIYVQVGAIITALVGLIVIFVTKVWPWFKAKMDRRSFRKGNGGELFPVDVIKRSTRYYIVPYCQSIDPAGGEEPRGVYGAQERLFLALDRLLNHPTEYKYLIILADSGRGKTSALINYFVRYVRRWKRKFSIVIIPLGIPNADDLINEIKSRDSQKMVTRIQVPHV
jgi:hypothetical protein